MVLFELLQLARVFLYYLLIEYLWHAFIMPLTNRNGITRCNYSSPSPVLSSARSRTPAFFPPLPTASAVQKPRTPPESSCEPWHYGAQVRSLAVISQKIKHDPVELFWLFHIRQVCRAVHDDLAHVR